MNQQQRDELKARWVDREVRVDAESISLRRFAGRTGIVREVNWNGHCLVDWQGVQDDGWYDIPPGQLVLVEKEKTEQGTDESPS